MATEVDLFISWSGRRAREWPGAPRPFPTLGGTVFRPVVDSAARLLAAGLRGAPDEYGTGDVGIR